jgi:hypothetical protein
MKKLKKTYQRFMFAWSYAYETRKWQYFSRSYKLKDWKELDRQIWRLVDNHVELHEQADELTSEIIKLLKVK